MPKKVYMPEDNRAGGGVAFLVSWDRLEQHLRGEGIIQPALSSDETCEFVVSSEGITVYVDKK